MYKLIEYFLCILLCLSMSMFMFLNTFYYIIYYHYVFDYLNGGHKLLIYLRGFNLGKFFIVCFLLFCRGLWVGSIY